MTDAAWHAFAAMGGYADYVWPAYAVFFAVLIIDALAPTVRRRRIVRELRAQWVRQMVRRERRGNGNTGSKAAGVDATPPRSA